MPPFVEPLPEDGLVLELSGEVFVVKDSERKLGTFHSLLQYSLGFFRRANQMKRLEAEASLCCNIQ
jgi:hypothetical protein